MPKREVDKRKTSKALRKLRRVAERATEEGAPALTTWEKDFVEGVTTRLEKYGSAFRDPGKGRLEEALSARQSQITRVIEKKTRKPKASTTSVADDKKPDAPRSTFQRGGPMSAKAGAKSKTGWKPRVRDINEDMETPAAPEPAPAPAATPAEKRAALKLIPGGKSR